MIGEPFFTLKWARPQAAPIWTCGKIPRGLASPTSNIRVANYSHSKLYANVTGRFFRERDIFVTRKYFAYVSFFY